MAFAPPSGYSVYDVALALSELLPRRIIIPSQAIAEAMNNLMANIWGWILKPIADAILGAVSFMLEMLGGIANGFAQALVNFVYLFIINPLKAMVQDALNRIYNKLEGVIFIAVTVPAMIAQSRMLMENPSMKGALLFMFKPLIGALVAKVTAGLIKPMLRPITIEPSTPPPIEIIPPPKEIGITPYDVVSIEDYLSIEIIPPMSFRDTIRIDDTLTLEALPPMSFRDYVEIEDYETIEIIPPFPLLDTIVVQDTLTIEVE